MKRIYAILLALALTLTSNTTFFNAPIYASSMESSTADSSTTEESSTQTEKEASSPTVNLLDDDTEKNDDTEEKTPETGAAYNLDKPFEDGPDVVAESALLMDARSGAILYAKESDTKRYPASITKVMTTLIAIEKCKMDDIITFSSSAVYGIEEGSSTAGINVGAKITVEDTLYALMLVSANEAGAAIAEHVSGSNEEFAKLMTERAKELGCTNTNFKNPHGLPDEEHYTTAHDMGLIMQEAMKHEEFRKISSTISYTISASDTVPEDIELWNHAKILRDNSEYYYEYAVGAKTGYTQAARNTLVTYAEKDGTQLLCVILKDYGADNSYYDSTRLYKWGFEQVKTITPLKEYDLEKVLTENEKITESELATYLSLNPVFEKNYPVLVKTSFDGKDLKKAFRLEEDQTEGRLGYIDVTIGDQTIFTTPVTYDLESEAAKNYLTKNDGGDDLETAKVTNKNSLLHRFFAISVRLIIACILVYIIMQLIHRWQVEKKRKTRIQKRKQKNQSSKKNSSASQKKKNTTVDENGIRRNRRH